MLSLLLNLADILKPIMHYLLQRRFRCALFAMMVFNCLKYHWNHLQKENTVKCNMCRASLSYYNENITVK